MPPKTIIELMEQRTVTIDDMFSCVLNIRPLEIQTYIRVLMGANTVQIISEQIQRTKSTVQRLLNQLMGCGLVKRESISREETGYYYIYEALPPEDVRNLLTERFESMFQKMQKYMSIDWVNQIETRIEEERKASS